MAEMKKVTVRVDEALHKRLAKKTKDTGVPQAEIVRRILKKHLR